MSQTNVSTFTNKCTDKWIRQASGMQKASASSLLMYLKDLRLEVGELLQDGRGILPSERIFFWCPYLGLNWWAGGTVKPWTFSWGSSSAVFAIWVQSSRRQKCCAVPEFSLDQKNAHVTLLGFGGKV